MTVLQVMERTTVSHQVAVRLLDLMLKGELKPGQKLPSERDLAASLGVGRPAVREALSALQMMQAVVIKRGDGIRVGSSGREILTRPLEIFAALEGVNVDALFEAREILEPGIAGLAAERMSEEKIASLRGILGELRNATNDSTRFLKLDEELHSVIIESCENSLLSSVMRSLGGLTHAFRQIVSVFPTFNDQVILEHEAIVAAIGARDAARSAQAMQAHIQSVRKIAEGAGSERFRPPGTPRGSAGA